MSELDCLFFLVSAIRPRIAGTSEKQNVITQGCNREEARQNAYKYLLGNPESYTVTPLTNRGEIVYLNLQVRN